LPGCRQPIRIRGGIPERIDIGVRHRGANSVTRDDAGTHRVTVALPFAIRVTHAVAVTDTEPDAQSHAFANAIPDPDPDAIPTTVAFAHALAHAGTDRYRFAISIADPERVADGIAIPVGHREPITRARAITERGRQRPGTGASALVGRARSPRSRRGRDLRLVPDPEGA
jgi:hypothetical protein